MSSRTVRNAHLRPLFAAVVLAAVTSVLPVASPATSAEPDTLIREIGRLDRVPADAHAIFGNSMVPRNWPQRSQGGSDTRHYNTGTMLVFPDVRQLWQFWYIANSAGVAVNTAIGIRDLDTLELKKTLVLDGKARRGNQSDAGGEWLHTYDPGRRVFLMAGTGGTELFEIDVRTFAVKRDPAFLPGGTNAPFLGLRLGGITYDPTAESVIGLFGFPASTNAANTNTVVFAKNPTTGATSGPRHVTSCTGPLPATDQSQTYGAIVLPTADAIYVPCHRAGMAGAVIRLARGTAYTQGSPEEVAVGPVYLETVLADPGSGRLLLVTVKGEIWAFDTRTMSFVGVVSSHAVAPNAVDVGYGLDPESGRLFFQSKTYGVGIAEGRFFPIPQALTLPTRLAPGQERILSDNRTGRFFVLEGRVDERETFYRIYKTSTAPAPPAVPDPDRSTVDRDEQPGVTQSRYFGSASGYGFRALLANGVSTAAPAPTIGALAPTAQVIADNINSKCGFTDRELVAGRVAKAEYDNASSAATAIAVGIDERTKQDIERPSRCDGTGRAGANQRFSGIFATAPASLVDDQDPDRDRWARKPAECTTSEGDDAKSKEGDDGGQVALGRSKVTCPTPGGELRAGAEAGLAGAVSVHRARSETVIKRTSQGVVSEVLSIAQDIDIAGVITIEEVRSKAVARSNGRPRQGNASTHEIRLKGVTAGGQQLCPDVCKDASAVIAELNRLSAGRAQFRYGSGLDDRLLRGTAKGALTAVQKSPERQASDQALVGDFTTEVPALELIVYNDNTEWGRARQLYQFAGVASVAGYSIALEPTAVAFPNDDDGGLPFDEDDSGGGDELGFAGGFGDGGGFGGGGDLGGIEGISDTDDEGGPIARVLQALARGIRLFWTDPRHALALFTGWLLFSLPGVLSRRRRLLVDARNH